jgi:hypothetical protein
MVALGQKTLQLICFYRYPIFIFLSVVDETGRIVDETGRRFGKAFLRPDCVNLGLC